MVKTGRWYRIRSAARFRLLLLAPLLLTAIALPGAVHASNTYYLLYHQWQPYDWPENVPFANEVTRSQRGLGWQARGSASVFGIDYDYQPLRIRTGGPASPVPQICSNIRIFTAMSLTGVSRSFGP